MTRNAQRINAAINAVSQVSEANSTSAEAVSSAAEEVTAQVEETLAATQTLNDLAQQLQQALARFTLDEAAAPIPLSTKWHGTHQHVA